MYPEINIYKCIDIFLSWVHKHFWFIGLCVCVHIHVLKNLLWLKLYLLRQKWMNEIPIFFKIVPLACILISDFSIGLGISETAFLIWYEAVLSYLLECPPCPLILCLRWFFLIFRKQNFAQSSEAWWIWRLMHKSVFC